ncbi:ABC transporter permease [Methylobrevis albus]|uniref:ABC transporter permease n=1 Tax=Methylobrevis albus TaxID=2793297 RepID=A0A931I055_9HYPH|nr:ABC transporter permease [Methylobrevis albus]MBH0237312.1 ABC transporter permease [Methylobrevis albus]
MDTGERASRTDAVRGAAWAAPAVLVTAAFFLLPLAVMALWSLWTRTAGGVDRTLTLANYARFFGESALVAALFNSLETAALVTVVSLVVGYPVAYALAFHVPARWQRLALVLAILPFWTSYVVRSYAWLLVLAPNGVVNQTLIGLGLTEGPVRIAYTMTATVLGFTHFFAMLVALTVYAGLKRINPRLLLAARDLGAGAVSTFLRVTLPLSVPAIATSAFLTFVLAIGDYITPQILGGNTSLVLPQAILFQIGRRGDVPMASAMSLVLMAVILVACLVALRATRTEPAR